MFLNVFVSLAKIERKNERLRGKMPEEEKMALKEELKRLKERLEAEKAVKRNVDSLLYKLEVSLSRCRFGQSSGDAKDVVFTRNQTVSRITSCRICVR